MQIHAVHESAQNGLEIKEGADKSQETDIVSGRRAVVESLPKKIPCQQKEPAKEEAHVEGNTECSFNRVSKSVIAAGDLRGRDDGE